jgi:hypothetical protein
MPDQTGMIDITGYDYALIRKFVVSRYAGESTIEERMADGPDAVDPFKTIAPIRRKLENFARKMQQRSADLTDEQVMMAFDLLKYRTD